MHRFVCNIFVQQEHDDKSFSSTSVAALNANVKLNGKEPSTTVACTMTMAKAAEGAALLQACENHRVGTGSPGSFSTTQTECCTGRAREGHSC